MDSWLLLALISVLRNAVATTGEIEVSRIGEAEVFTNEHERQAVVRSTRSTNLRPGSAKETHSCERVRGVPPHLRSKRSMGLSMFYQKYTEAYGIPVIAAREVADDALKRLCYIVRFLFADRRDVRNQYYKHFGRMAVIGKKQKSTDIPEHSHQSSRWNIRARGFGATVQFPVCSVAEENLLCEKKIDLWAKEDIGIHEIAHGVHTLGAHFAIPEFHRRIEKTFVDAKRKGLWKNTYAITSFYEYFAEGTRAYFDVKPHSSSPNGVHNSVTTREKLRKYDPDLFKLLKEVFPCGNKYIKRCGGSQSQLRREESSTKIRMNCIKTHASSCVDNSLFCLAWFKMAYCDKSPRYMNDKCPKSCHQC